MKKMKAQKNRFTKAFAGLMGCLVIALTLSAPASAAQVCLNNGSSSTPSSVCTNYVSKTNGTCSTSAKNLLNCLTANSNAAKGNTAGCQTAGVNTATSNTANCANLSKILASLTGSDAAQVQQMLKSGNINLNVIKSLCSKSTQTTVSKPTTTKPAAPVATKPTTPATPTKPTTPTTGGTTTTAPAGVTAMEQQMVNLVNSERAKAGVAPLKIDAKLTHVAEVKAKDMIDNNYFSHTSPTYGSPFDMMKTFGITYRTAGENIAMNQTVQAAHTAFMNSSGHRANILNSSFTTVGIGIVSDGKGNIYISQMFIGN